ncbi:MAG: ABC transporter permease subunit [Candidatus Handelsmanbacteria bacterium]|nr:ABC transporter permease subunit [Candidatus Handelsmanbacteria bacterium]
MSSKAWKPIARFGGSLLLKLLGITLFVYVVLYVTPGSNLEEMQRHRAVKERSVGKLVSGYLDWAGGAVRGNLGTCEGTPVVERLGSHVPRTLKLVGGSLVLSLALALGMTVISLHANNLLTKNLVSLLNLISGLHIIVLSFAMIILGWVQPNAGFSPWLLVILTFGNGTLVDYYSVIRTQISQALHQDYAIAAMSRGASQLRHATLYEITLGLMDATNSRIQTLVGGTIIVEWVFSYLGLGYDIIKAIELRNVDLIMGVTVAVALLLIFLGELTDTVRNRLDPKLSR